MVSPLVAGLRGAEIHPAETLKRAAYSDERGCRKRSDESAQITKKLVCKPRANCLNPKESRKSHRLRPLSF
jgi:hypothetical protein